MTGPIAEGPIGPIGPPSGPPPIGKSLIDSNEAAGLLVLMNRLVLTS